jgi:hypothetical protein
MTLSKRWDAAWSNSIMPQEQEPAGPQDREAGKTKPQPEPASSRRAFETQLKGG